MAFTTTTLSAACAIGDTTIKVTAATDFDKGDFIRVDDEFMEMTAAAVGTRIPVRRGVNGTVAAAHVITANATVGVGSDWANPAPTRPVSYPLGGRDRRRTGPADANGHALFAADR